MTTVALIRLVLKFLEPVTIADPHQKNATVDRAVLRTPQGEPWIPPSSIAGALREHLNTIGIAETYMGSESGAEELSPSMLRVLRTGLADFTVASRTQTRVDRFRGAATNRSLRSSERLETGAVLTVDLQLDSELTDELKLALGSWQPDLGGSRSTGQGRTELQSWQYGELDLAVPADLKAWFTLGGPALVDNVVKADGVVNPPAVNNLVFNLTFESVDGLLIDVIAAGDEERIDRRCGEKIEGSTLRGVFRSRAEYISASLEHAITGKPPAAYKKLLDNLFGNTDKRGCVRFPTTELRGGTTEARMHVAIDRVTSGYADKKLFTDEIKCNAEDSNVEFDVNIEQISPLPGWAKPLLSAVVADIDGGLIGFGACTGRGHGTVRLVDNSSRNELAKIDLQLVEQALQVQLDVEANRQVTK